MEAKREKETRLKAYRPAQAAKLLSLSERMVTRLVSTGELKSFKVGRARLIPLAAIDQFIKRSLDE